MTRQKNKRGDIEKWDQTTALRFQTGGRHVSESHPPDPFSGPTFVRFELVKRS